MAAPTPCQSPPSRQGALGFKRSRELELAQVSQKLCCEQKYTAPARLRALILPDCRLDFYLASGGKIAPII
jgi:hypothetical protein